MNELKTQSRDAREAILARVREALQAPTVRGHDHHDAAPEESLAIVPPADARRWLPPVGASYEDRLELFAERCDKLKTEFVRVGSQEEAARALGGLCERGSWRIAAHHAAELVEACVAPLGCERLNVAGGYAP
jgi:L-lactate dehydrogenase complex protein LldG